MDSVKAGSTRRASLVQENVQAEAVWERRLDDGTVDLHEYLDAIRQRWPAVALATVLVMAVTGLFTGFVMTRWYRAEAIIRPVNASVVQNRISGLLGGFGGLGAKLLGSEASNPASEYMPILKSFQFTTRLVAEHHLKNHLDSRRVVASKDGAAVADWARYDEMRKRFTCEFSIRTGNLTLYYKDPDRSMAGKILGFYISDLRALLRSEQIRDTREAIASLRAETRDTEDTLLQTELYELLARQLQQQKLAQVDADFAFRVLQAPTTPIRPYRPDVVRDIALAGVMTLMLALMAVVVMASRRQ